VAVTADGNSVLLLTALRRAIPSSAGMLNRFTPAPIPAPHLWLLDAMPVAEENADASLWLMSFRWSR
jgi:hypothetical protein